MEEYGSRTREQVKNITAAFELDYKLNFAVGTPAINNNADVTEIGRLAAAKVMGEDRIVRDILELGSDDVARYMEVKKGAYFLLGTESEKCNQELHTARFNLDDSILPERAAIMAHIAHDLMRKT